jgi:hypothetical protein
MQSSIPASLLSGVMDKLQSVSASQTLIRARRLAVHQRPGARVKAQNRFHQPSRLGDLQANQRQRLYTGAGDHLHICIRERLHHWTATPCFGK